MMKNCWVSRFKCLLTILLIAGGLVSVSHAAEKQRVSWVPGEVIVKLKPQGKIESIEAKKANRRKVMRSSNRHFRNKGLDRLYVLKVQNTHQAIKRLRKNPHVEYVGTRKLHLAILDLK